MHQCLVVLASEGRIRRGYFGGRLALLVDYLEFHRDFLLGRLGGGLGGGLCFRFGGRFRLWPRDWFRFRFRGGLGRDGYLHRTRRRANRYIAATRTGKRTPDQQQLTPGIDADYLEVLGSVAGCSHVAGHALAREDASGILVLADGARLVVRYRVAVARTVRREVVALDDAGEALALRDARNVHFLSDFEDVDADGSAQLEVGDLLGLDAEFP